MSMPDNLIIEYFKVYTEVPLEEISQMERDLPSDPMKFKLLLAKEIVKRYHGEKVAEEELQWFKKTFSEQQIPEDAPVISLGSDSASAFEVLRKCFAPKEKSNSEIRRLIRQGAVKVDGRTVESYEEVVHLPLGGVKLRVGRRNWFKIVP
jgi:tyrosyl-tRNA synthetase